ncbi:MAG: O-antigen ligase family protein [Thermoguttaceae bacterium]
MTSQTGSRECKQRTISGRRRPASRGGGDLGTKQIIDAALAGCLFLVPAAMGGRHPLGEVLLAVLAVLAALAWTAQQAIQARPTWRWTPAMALVPAGAALLMIQLTPLPQTFLAWISPHAIGILPLWSSVGDPAARLGIWNTISLAPAETRADLAIFLAYGLLFLIAVQHLRTLEDIERLLGRCALAAVLMAAFALVQYFAGNGRFYWFYEHPFSSASDAVKGSFTNRNHFAQFLALGIGPLVYCVHRTLAHDVRRGIGAYLPMIGLGVVVFAGLLSLSRGGAVAMVVAGTVAITILVRTSIPSKKQLLVSLGAVGLVLSVALAIFGYDRVSTRLDDFSSGSLDRLDGSLGRRVIWGADLRAILDAPLFGWGAGSHRYVYPMYFPWPCETEYTHAENSYLQVVMESGAAGLLLAAAGVAQCVLWCVAGLYRTRKEVADVRSTGFSRNPAKGPPKGGTTNAGSRRAIGCFAAVAGSLAANAVHALVDFVWYAPGCMVIVILLAAAACRLYQIARGSGKASGKGDRHLLCDDQRCASVPAEGPFRQKVPVPFSQSPADAAAPEVRSGSSSDIDSSVHELPRLAVAAIALAVAVVGIWMIGSRVGPLLAEPDWNQSVAVQVDSTLPRTNPREVARKEIHCLERVVRQQEDHARAHLELARRYVDAFELEQATAENRMSLACIRDAAVASRFHSREELGRWLDRAVGESWKNLDAALRHAHRALELCPLEGGAYLLVAKLCFLDGLGPHAAAYVNQAVAVRPFDGDILFGAGEESWLAGDSSRWLEYMQRAARSGPSFRERVFRGLIDHVPPDGLETAIDFVVRQFHPDLDGVRLLHGVAAGKARGDQLAALKDYYAAMAAAEARRAEPARAAPLWLEAGGLYRELHRDEPALECLRSACRSSPDDYEICHALALRLMDAGAYGEAENQVQWCIERKPQDESLRQLVKDLLRKRPGGNRGAVAQETPGKENGGVFNPPPAAP